MTLEKIIEKITLVPWNNVKISDGHCTDMEKRLLGLISNDKSVQENSYWSLDNYIIIQGDLYEGSFYIIPFLFELLKSDELDFDKSYIYALLTEISNGFAPVDRVINYNVKNEGFKYYTPSFPSQNIPLSIACRSEVLDHVSYFFDEMRSKQSNYQLLALELLESFAEHEEPIKNGLNTLLDEDISHSLRVAVMKSLSRNWNSGIDLDDIMNCVDLK